MAGYFFSSIFSTRFIHCPLAATIPNTLQNTRAQQCAPGLGTPFHRECSRWVNRNFHNYVLPMLQLASTRILPPLYARQVSKFEANGCNSRCKNAGTIYRRILTSCTISHLNMKLTGSFYYSHMKIQQKAVLLPQAKSITYPSPLFKL